MAVTRLSGGLTPGDGADPRTFPAIWNATAAEIETAQADIVSNGTAITGLESDLNTLDATVTANGTAITGLESDVADRVVKDDEAGAPFVVWGEENAAGGTIGQNLSLGNGATSLEIPMPAAGKITALAMMLETSGTTTTLQLVKNGTLQGAGYQISGSANRQTVTLATPMTFAAGDSVNLQFTVGGVSRVVASAFGYWT